METRSRALTYARQMAAAQVAYARGYRAAQEGRRSRPPEHCPDPVSWRAGYAAGRRAAR